MRKHCIDAGHPDVRDLSRSRLHGILAQGEIRSHRIRYYVQRRDPEFEEKMAVVLHLFKEVEIVNAELLEGTLKGTCRGHYLLPRSPAFRLWRRQRLSFRPCPTGTGVIFGMASTCDWERCRCWRALISIRDESPRSSVIAMPARTSSGC
jgi:hypothetical protein